MPWNSGNIDGARRGGEHASLAAAREFRANLRRLRRLQLSNNRTDDDSWWRRRIYRMVGDLRRPFQALRDTRDGISKYDAAVAGVHGISRANQFVHLFADIMRYGTNVDEFYLYRFYLPEHRRDRALHFPFLTQNILVMAALVKLQSPLEAEVLHDKSAFADRCREHSLPTPANIAVFENGVMTVGAAPLPGGDFFSKPARRWGGSGARLWVDGTFSADELVKTLCKQSNDEECRILLQRRITNHPSLRPLTNGALCTLRLVTHKNLDGEIELLPPVIRLPHGDSIVDNFAQGGLVAPIDAVTGVICAAAIKKHATLGAVRLEQHPDSGTMFQGFQIPFWNEAVALARRAHHAFSTVAFIGWDIPILPDGPTLLEGNQLWDTNLMLAIPGLTLSDTSYVSYCNALFPEILSNYARQRAASSKARRPASQHS